MSRPGRLALLLPGMIGLLAGLVSALARLGWLPGFTAIAAGLHGPFMLMAFLGTLIPLERAVALDRPWGYAAPALSGLGGLLLLLGLPVHVGGSLATLGAAGLVALFAALARREPALHLGVMAVAAFLLFASDLAWLLGTPPWRVSWGWVGFLVLTIVGERMELSRVRRLPDWGTHALRALVFAQVLAIGASFVWPDAGVRALGAVLLLTAVWLLVFDVARRTIRADGLTRFVAACLLSGYAWLGVGGVLALAWGEQVAGLRYDAQLHAIFVGFVLSMIFGHAPVIFPAVLKVPIRYAPASWAPLVLLHASLTLRVAGDVAAHAEARAWGGMLNVAAVLLFLLLTAGGVISGLVRGRAGA